jgi:hypothetical protein
MHVMNCMRINSLETKEPMEEKVGETLWLSLQPELVCDPVQLIFLTGQ